MKNPPYDNPYNRVAFDPEVTQWIVLVQTNAGMELATRSAFANREDAGRYADTVADCYHTVIAQTNPSPSGVK